MPRKKRPNRQPGHTEPWKPDQRQMEIYYAVIQGRESQTEIGKRFHITQQYVSYICKQVNQWRLPQIMDSIRELKVEHTARLMEIFRECMQAWDRSKENAVSVKEAVRPVEPGEDSDLSTVEGIEIERTTKGQAGNPAFLAQAAAVLEQIRKIWGANAPLKVEHSGEVRVAGRPDGEAKADLLARMRERQERLMAPSEN